MSIRDQMNDGRTFAWPGLCRVLSVMILSWTFAGTVSAEEPIFSRSSKFKIPFQFDNSELQKLGATKIQLFVSENQGASWKLQNSVDPADGHFLYEAGNDGEFWFSVRTLVAGGLTYPAGDHEAGLKVIVDTSRPEFSLTLEELKPGQIELQWNAADAHLNVDSLFIEFLDPTLDQWEPVSVQSAAQGRTSWTVAQPGLVESRGLIRDSAGNSTAAVTQAIVTGTTVPKPSSTHSKISRPVAVESNGGGAEMRSNQPISSIISIQPRSGGLKLTPRSEKPPVIPANASNPAIVKAISESSPDGEPQPTRSEPFHPQAEKSTSVADADRPVASSIADNVIEEPAELSVVVDETPLRNEPVYPSSPPKTRDGHLVNSNTFRIAYELEDVGPSGVSKVELYITEDQGRTWFHYGSDDDLVSPFIVTVPQDGDYGFTFRIRNGLGLIATPPQPEERADIHVTVDQQAPEVELLPLTQGTGIQDWLIQWTANDRELDDHPIALYFATQATGPWELIDGWRANTSEYQWTIPASLDKKIYIRLDVRDAAGNITRIDGEEPLTIDRSRPRAKITDVESLKISPR